MESCRNFSTRSLYSLCFQPSCILSTESHAVCKSFAVHAQTTITFDGAMSSINFDVSQPVTLDGLNDEDATFLFIAGSTLVTAANSYFILINGAKAENVIWAVGSGATLGVHSILKVPFWPEPPSLSIRRRFCMVVPSPKCRDLRECGIC